MIEYDFEKLIIITIFLATVDLLRMHGHHCFASAARLAWVV